AAKEIAPSAGEDFPGKLAEAAGFLKAQRPTAVNLFWAIDRMLSVAARFHSAPPDVIYAALEAE
ncbi:MAG TPA: S-methyl-5-thioribose-1-phosphate isomerase, partial [Firmicutes bacterium]|nr:S-methyl-5-thioribose-1-phosphate isomerase [Bacillota bacterium]